MIVVVTGGRDFRNRRTVETVLDDLHATHGVAALYHGDCRGADTLAAQWALRRQNIRVLAVPADWSKGRQAGPARNREMLEEARELGRNSEMPVLLVAFPGGPGTASCIRSARQLGIRVKEAA